MNKPNGPSFSTHDVGALVTRDCIDPWRYIEIGANGDIRPCCNFYALSKLGEEQSDFDAIRNGIKFQALRRSLLDGRLEIPCLGCHIRKTVPSGFLKARLRLIARRINLDSGLTALPISTLRIDINENCNLRCDYCAVSAPSYNGVEMTDAVFQKILLLLSTIKPGARVYVNGHGETTHHPRWMELCEKIFDAGHRPGLTTN